MLAGGGGDEGERDEGLPGLQQATRDGYTFKIIGEGIYGFG